MPGVIGVTDEKVCSRRTCMNVYAKIVTWLLFGIGTYIIPTQILNPLIGLGTYFDQNYAADPPLDSEFGWYLKEENGTGPSMLEPAVLARTDNDTASPTYGLWTPPPGARRAARPRRRRRPGYCSRRRRRSSPARVPHRAEWRAHCDASGGVPMSACSYFMYEDVPAVRPAAPRSNPG